MIVSVEIPDKIAEQFLHDHGAPPNVTSEEHLRDLANLDRFRTR